jgi:hypothetical protein
LKVVSAVRRGRDAPIAERGGRTPQGKQFLMKAQEDMRREDFASAIRNLQMAMTFEADNDYFKSLLEEARKRNK